jgi:carboxymethylenebutenolidase
VCFEFDARPPELPADLVLPTIMGGAAAETLELEAADGIRFGAALAISPGATDPAVIILPDVRGLYRFYIELAERFAASGHHAIAIDYFGRTAGVEERGEDFDFMAHLPETTAPQVQQDIAAARAALAERTGAGSFVTVGFCFGGSQSFLSATNPELGTDAAIGFYGTLNPSRIGFPFEMPAPLASVADTRLPVLGLFGGDDAYIPAEDIAAFDAGLTKVGVEHELITYPGAPHSFFDRSAAEYADASGDAWRRVLGFLDTIGAATVSA